MTDDHTLARTIGIIDLPDQLPSNMKGQVNVCQRSKIGGEGKSDLT